MTRPQASPALVATTILLLQALLSLTEGRAEDPLTPYRQGFLAAIANQTLPLEVSYAERLPTLERSFAEKKDYQAAAAVAKEIRQTELRIAALRAALAVAPQDATAATNPALGKDGRIVLLSTDAKLSPGTRLDQDTGAVTGFERAETWAEWKLPTGLASGGYEVVLNYSCGENEGGSIQVQEGFFFLPATVKSTGSIHTVKSATIGTLRIAPTSGTLRVVAKTVRNESLMQLRSIELVPALYFTE